MTCSRFKEVAHEYFLDRLSREEVQRIDAHLQTCADCSDFMRLCRELSCRDLVEFLNDYVDGILPPERRAVFERHLAICPDCTNYLESYRRTIALSALALGKGGLDPAGPVPEGLIQAVLEAYRKSERG